MFKILINNVVYVYYVSPGNELLPTYIYGGNIIGKVSTLPPNIIKAIKVCWISVFLKQDSNYFCFFIRKLTNSINILQCVRPLKLFLDLENKFRKV